MAVGAKHFGSKSPLPTHNLTAEMLRPDDILGKRKKYKTRAIEEE